MLRTTLLLAALTGLILGIGQWLGGPQGFVIAFVFAVLMNFGSYWFSDTIVLTMYRAREVSDAEAPMLCRILHNLALRAGMPMPRLYLIPSEAVNAFVTGRDPQHAAVAVTEGILCLMSERALIGVLAHELSHVKNRDILIGSIAALVIQMALSRTREYEADASGARLAGDPLRARGGAAKARGCVRAARACGVTADRASLHCESPLRAFPAAAVQHAPTAGRADRAITSHGRGASLEQFAIALSVPALDPHPIP
jgi:Zn-dependent protease with chaperone function